MYIVIELQKNGDQVANIVTSHSTRQEAEAKYHTILAAAAVSGVEVHSAVMLSDEGFPLRNECYKDKPAQAPAPVVEPETVEPDMTEPEE